MEQVAPNPIQAWKFGRGRKRRNPAILVVPAMLAAGIPVLFGQPASEPLEYQVKAAFLLNFTKFIEWPPTAFEAQDSPVSICILGEDPFGTTLDQIVSGEVVNGRKVVTRRIKRPPPPQSCQVLFAGRQEKEVLKILPTLGPGVLTVGEGDSFVRGTGMIAFVMENRRVRFDINQAAAENAGLKLSSRLLTVARAVEK